MKKFDLQMFAEAISGSKLVYLYRIMSKASTENGLALAFTTENERTKTKDSDSVITKDGAIRIPGAAEVEITATSLLTKGSTFVDELEDAMDSDALIEIWEANLENPAEEGENKFVGMYFQGYLTEVTRSSNAEDHVEISLTFAINGSGKRGNVTVTTEQQAVAEYVFTDTNKTGA